MTSSARLVWPLVRVGDAFPFTKKPRGLDIHRHGSLPFIPMSLIPFDGQVISEYELLDVDDIASGTYVEPGDLLVAKITPSFENGKQGMVGQLPTPFGYATTEVIPVKDISGVSDRRYLSYYLLRRGVRAELAAKMQGTTGRQRLDKNSLAEFELPLPSLPEQRAIARVLCAVQNAKDARQRELVLERERKAALMEYLFTYGASGQDRKTHATRFGNVPANWGIIPLVEAASVQTGITLGRRFDDDDDLITVPYLTVVNVQDGYLDLSQVKRTQIRRHELERYRLQDGDVLFTEGGDFDKLGRGFIWRGELEVCAHQNHVFAVRVKREILNPEFLAYQAQSPYGKAYFLSVAHKTTNLASINSTKLKGFPVLVAPLDEQQAITAVLGAVDGKIGALELEFTLLNELFHALLEELMTGRLSVAGMTAEDESLSAHPRKSGPNEV